MYLDAHPVDHSAKERGNDLFADLKPLGKDRLVFVIVDNINVVYNDKNEAILSEGLQVGEQVITSLLGGVIDGMGVEVQEGAPTKP